MKYNKSAITNIFYSGGQDFRVDKQLVVDVCFLLDNNLLYVKKEKTCLYNIYQGYAELINRGEIPIIDIEGGSTGHLALKLIGRDYLKKLGHNNFKFESELEGYRPDLMTRDSKIIIECGSTNPDKIFYYFKNKNLEKLIVIPYPDHEGKEIYLYIFTPGKDLSDFLIFNEQQKLKSIKHFKNK